MLLNEFKNKKILIVEDDSSSSQLLTEYFSLTGVKIVLAKTGNEAIHFFKKYAKEIDLILMDIKLPEKNGLKATQEIRLFNKHIPIIAQTASVSHEEVKSYLSSGMNDCIPKPYRQDEIINIVLKHLPKQKSLNV